MFSEDFPPQPGLAKSRIDGCITWLLGRGKLGPGTATYSFPWIPNVPPTTTCLVEGYLSRRVKSIKVF